MAKLSNNLASRPFVNTRPLVIAMVSAAVALAVCAFLNFYWLFGSWYESSSLARELAINRAEIAEAKSHTETLVKSIADVDRKRIRAVAVTTRGMIEKRRLAWTRLFDQLEAVLPRNVRILSIVPDVRDTSMTLLMDATAKDNEVKLKFYRKLQAPPFSDAYIMGETLETDKIRFQVRASYNPDGPDAQRIHEPMPWELAATQAAGAGPGDLRSAAAAAGTAAATATPDPARFYLPSAASTPAGDVIDSSLLGGFAPAPGGSR